MNAKTRRKYSQEFKEEAVSLVTRQGYRASEAARNLGINVSMLRRWVRLAEGKQTQAAAQPNPESLEKELRKLRRENERLKEEREILKKAAAFFAKESE